MMILNRPSPNTYLEHARQNQLIQVHKKGKAILEQPVCPKCERAGFRDKGWRENMIMTCPHCGYHGATTVVLQAYLKEGLYK